MKMGSTFCPADNISHMSSVARDVCPFPDYTPNPLFTNMLSVNSSLQLKHHYTAVQSSLNPKQLEDFTKSLRSTFGREGRVSYGGVGVVALSLAVLFDTLAKQAKGEQVSDSGPIPGLFIKDLRGYYPPHVHTVSEYLRLVPHIANNPTRMKEETERYIKLLTIDDQKLENLGENNMFAMQEDVPLLNVVHGKWFANNLKVHFLRLKNATADELVHSKERPPAVITFNLNCDPETADKDFKAHVQRSDSHTQEAFQKYMTKLKPWLLQVAELEWLNTMFHLACEIGMDDDLKVAQRGDFDLKANALGKWAE
ncbi:uncharacterized protein LOC117827172 [Notolabrus celidotus]|uniref:uncharacterized protein LOC117827172 n=1 Tax=Notolabrus celidotus TaxID=1203425 RepID=UPI00148FBBEA|nr:uncharacterized protein LOC117827172 [Notolabrus celidotus]